MLIKDINKTDRPREKLIANGPHSLSDIEILAILLNTGNKNESAIELANNLLKKYRLDELIDISYNKLSKEKGIKEAKACKIIASFELGKRAVKRKYEQDIIIDSANKAYDNLYSDYMYLKNEVCFVLMLDTKLRLIKKEQLSKGFLNNVEINVRELVNVLYKYDAYGFILAHNHPSNDSMPSKEDKYLTNFLYKITKDIGFYLLDHIIWTRDSYFSFNENHILDMYDS